MWHRKTKWTTTRWVWPEKIRIERYKQLHASSKYKDVFDLRYLDGLEKRRELIEGRRYKSSAIQIPLFLLLTFSLLHLDLTVSIAGFSIASARGLREILLL